MYSILKLTGKHSRYCNSCGKNAHVQLQAAVMPEPSPEDDRLVTALLDFCRRCSSKIGSGLVRAAVVPKTPAKKRRR